MTTARMAGLAVVFLLFAPASAADMERFETQLLALGHAELSAPQMGRSGDFLKELAALTGLEEAEVRSNLLTLTDSLEARRKRKTAAWEALLALRPEGVEKREVADFLRHLLKESRKLVKGEESRSLGAAVKKAGRRARLTYDGQALLLRIIGEPSRRSAQGRAADRKVGLLVEARPFLLHEDSPRENREDRLEALRAHLLGRPDNNFYMFFGIDTPQAVLDKSDELFAAVNGALIETLPRSERVKWAVDTAGKQLQPDYRLLVRYRYGLSNPEQTGTEEWMISFDVAEVRLIDIETKSEVFGENHYPVTQSIRLGEEGNIGQAAAGFAESLARTVDAYLTGR